MLMEMDDIKGKKSTSEKIMNWVIGFEDWCEKNKQEFIRKNNPELYKKLYGKIQN